MVGAPTQNLVSAYPGTTGTIPRAPAISFSDVTAGDEAGVSIRLLDIDADGSGDIVIGAPGGDGPSNGGANAGNVYVFLGPVTAGAHSVSEAPSSSTARPPISAPASVSPREISTTRGSCFSRSRRGCAFRARPKPREVSGKDLAAPHRHLTRR